MGKIKLTRTSLGRGTFRKDAANTGCLQKRNSEHWCSEDVERATLMGYRTD
jgi:hypothetical protein